MKKIVEPEKWTYEVCKSKGQLYKAAKEWKEKCEGSYSKASRKNWLPDCYPKK